MKATKSATTVAKKVKTGVYKLTTHPRRYLHVHNSKYGVFATPQVSVKGSNEPVKGFKLDVAAFNNAIANGKYVLINK